MALRNVINRHGVWIAAASLVVAALVLWRGGFGATTPAPLPPAPPAQKEFFDTETRELAMRPASDVPPLAGKSGNLTLVEARFAKGADGSRRLVYLLKYSDSARDARLKAQAGQPFDVAALEDGALVASPDRPDIWVAESSPQGRAITQSP